MCKWEEENIYLLPMSATEMANPSIVFIARKELVQVRQHLAFQCDSDRRLLFLIGVRETGRNF